MSLRVKDACHLEYLNEFELIAGLNGLGNIITTIGILDHELLDNNMTVFVEGEFVLTTFSVIRNDPDKVFSAIKSLVKRKASGLAIKNVYYQSLPQDIIRYADEHQFPIFIYDASIFIENIIKTVFNGIKSIGDHALMEAKLENLFQGELTPRVIREIVSELNSDFKEHHQVIYCQEIRYLSSDHLLQKLDRYNRSHARTHHGLFKFRKGLLAIVTSESETQQFDLEMNHLMQSLGLDSSQYYIGKSNCHTSLSKLNQSIRECYYAYQAGLLSSRAVTHFNDIGIYKLILPQNNNEWTTRFSQHLIEPLIQYDDKHQTKLYETLRLYFDSGCQTQAVANAMFQHKNTILYRLNKIKELCGPFDHELEFIQQMSIAVKLYEMKRLSFWKDGL